MLTLGVAISLRQAEVDNVNLRGDGPGPKAPVYCLNLFETLAEERYCSSSQLPQGNCLASSLGERSPARLLRHAQKHKPTQGAFYQAIRESGKKAGCTPSHGDTGSLISSG